MNGLNSVAREHAAQRFNARRVDDPMEEPVVAIEHVESDFFEDPLPPQVVCRKIGRPRKEPEDGIRAKVIASLEDAQRHRFFALGLTEAQQIEAVAYCRRGFTEAAAVRITLAGGARPGLFA